MATDPAKEREARFLKRRKVLFEIVERWKECKRENLARPRRKQHPRPWSQAELEILLPFCYRILARKLSFDTATKHALQKLPGRGYPGTREKIRCRVLYGSFARSAARQK